MSEDIRQEIRVLRHEVMEEIRKVKVWQIERESAILRFWMIVVYVISMIALVGLYLKR